MTRTTPVFNATYLQPGETLCLLLTSAAVQRFIKWQEWILSAQALPGPFGEDKQRALNCFSGIEGTEGWFRGLTAQLRSQANNEMTWGQAYKWFWLTGGPAGSGLTVVLVGLTCSKGIYIQYQLGC